LIFRGRGDLRVLLRLALFDIAPSSRGTVFIGENSPNPARHPTVIESPTSQRSPRAAE
jgi:hypothetical protein